MAAITLRVVRGLATLAKACSLVLCLSSGWLSRPKAVQRVRDEG